MSDLTRLSLAELAAEIRDGRVSPLEATDACLDRIGERDGILNSFLTVTADAARADARRLGEELSGGRSPRGPLHGVPLALKDLFLTEGVRTTAGSAILRDWVPDHDATVVRKLKDAGAVSLGKLGMHEFAFGVTNENDHYGPVRNPCDPSRSPGGSSGGSGAAVADYLCFGSLGTDTGGSIRIPASLCGIVGLKPTYGRVSRHGVLPLCWSLDHVGPMARTVEDAALLLEAIAGADAADPTTLHAPVAPGEFTQPLERGVRGLRLGVPREHFWECVQPGVEAQVRTAIAQLEAQGAEIREVSLPTLNVLSLAQSAIILSEATAVHRHYLRERSTEYGSQVRIRLLEGLFISAADYLDAQRARKIIRREFMECLSEVDAFLTPATPITAPRIGEATLRVGEVEMPTSNYLVWNTAAFNLTGLPAISVPCGAVNGLPVGLQIAAGALEEALVLRIARAVEQAQAA